MSPEPLESLKSVVSPKRMFRALERQQKRDAARARQMCVRCGATKATYGYTSCAACRETRNRRARKALARLGPTNRIVDSTRDTTPPTRREIVVRPAPIVAVDQREFYVMFDGT